MFRNRAGGRGTEARVVSPWFGSSGPQCTLNFSLSMNGHVDVGQLRVWVVTVGAVGWRWDGLEGVTRYNKTEIDYTYNLHAAK